MKMAHNTPKFHSLESRSTEELEAMLRSDMNFEQELPPEILDQILTILQSRNALCDLSPQETDAAWKRFQARCKVYPAESHSPHPTGMEQPQYTKSPPATKRTRLWLRGCMAAVIACVLILFVPPALGAENLCDAIVHWTRDVLSFQSPTETAPPTTDAHVFSSDHPGLCQVYDEVQKLGITTPVVPTWLPEGYKLAELSADTLDNQKYITAFFTSENSTIAISIYQTAPGNAAPTLYDKNGEEPQVITKNGITYYIFQNVSRWKCTWSAGDVTCMISTSSEKDELLRILDSIYQGGTL